MDNEAPKTCWKEMFLKAVMLRESPEPRKIKKAMSLYKAIINSPWDDSQDCLFWKTQAAIELGLIYAAGIDNVSWMQDGGDNQSECEMEPDLFRAYEMFLLAVRNGGDYGVKLIGEMYMAIGDFHHAAKAFAAVVRNNFQGADEARENLNDMVERGLIDSIPDLNPDRPKVIIKKRGLVC